jgi:hypothetical protein
MIFLSPAIGEYKERRSNRSRLIKLTHVKKCSCSIPYLTREPYQRAAPAHHLVELQHTQAARQLDLSSAILFILFFQFDSLLFVLYIPQRDHLKNETFPVIHPPFLCYDCPLFCSSAW